MTDNQTNHKYKDIFCVINSKGGVGKSTVRAFTMSAATILILDALFGYLL